MVGVFTPFLLERLPPGVGKEGHTEKNSWEKKKRKRIRRI